MLEQRIQQHFFDSADLQYQAADGLSRPIASAAHALVGCITSGGKLLVFGSGSARGVARRIVDAMVGRFERDRPGLAAIELRAGLPGSVGAVATQVHALGSSGDVLLILCGEGGGADLVEAVREAHRREMTVVAIAGRQAASLAGAVLETDVLVQVPHDREARVGELQLLIAHCLCDAVDLQLMGEEQSA